MNIAQYRQEVREIFNDSDVEGLFGYLEYDDIEDLEEVMEAWARKLSADMYVRSLVESIVYQVEIPLQDMEDALFVQTRGRLPNWVGD